MARPIGIVRNRTPKLRARRISVDVASKAVRGTVVHASLGTFEGEVQDLSLHGVAIHLETLAEPTFFAGDRLESVEILFGERSLYRGAGTVRRIAGADQGVVVGIELDGGGLDLAEFHRHGVRRNFAQRLREFEDAAGRKAAVRENFKAWVADLRNDLTAFRKFMGEEEANYASEDLAVRQETERLILGELTPWIVRRMFHMRDELAALAADFTEEEHATHRAYLKNEVMHLFAESPFIRRASTKPLGYAGDYEMMNMLYRDHREGASLYAKALNVYATSEDAAVANINRIEFLGGLIRSRVALSNRERVRIASIGCGPAKEIAALLEESPELGNRLEVALIDQEERSIAQCERDLVPYVRSTGIRVQFIRESLRRLLTTASLGEALGQREFIYSAGLFDYLSDRTFKALLTTLYGALSEGGMVAIGNVASGNPSRWTMEYILEWFLIHRTQEELVGMTSDLTPKPSWMEVTSEPTGINLFLLVNR